MIVMRRKGLLFLLMCMSAIFAFADKLPKAVEKARASVASVVTYRQGVMLHNGVAVFAGENGELLSSRSLFVGADSAVVIDCKGVVHPVEYIVGVNEVLDCIKVRVNADKKIKPLVSSSLPVAVGETLYLLGYGVDKAGFVEEVVVERVDSVYSCAYYTFKKPMESRFLSLPVVNAKGLNMNSLLTKFAIKALFCGVDIEQLDINAPIPRRLAALCLWLAAQVLNESGCDTSAKSAGAYVTDISGCSASERKAIAYLYESGILKGYQVQGQKFYPEAGLKTEAGNNWLAAVKQCWK